MKPPELWIYESGYSDALIVRMWQRMNDDGDVATTFSPVMTLARIFRMIQPPNGMLFARDVEGVWFAMWFEPFMAGLSVGLWVRMDYRRTRIGLEAILEGYRLLLDQVPCLFGVTKQEKLLPAHIGLGYDVLGKAPALWDGVEDAWLVMLTRQGYRNALARLRPASKGEVYDG